jgi:D-aminoacyl-tRNA deacylase
MRAVIQRVKSAAVRVDGDIVGQIGQGLVVLVGVAKDDGPEDVDYMARKIGNLRVFPEHDRLLHFTTAEVGGGVLVVSQFTVFGDCRKGRRPSFDQSAPPELAEKLYKDLVAALAKTGLPVATGRFRAMMEVSLVNDGPVTLLLDSKKLF